MNSKYYSAKMNGELREREKWVWKKVGGLEVWKLGCLDHPSCNPEKSEGRIIFADSQEFKTKRS